MDKDHDRWIMAMDQNVEMDKDHDKRIMAVDLIMDCTMDYVYRLDMDTGPCMDMR